MAEEKLLQGPKKLFANAMKAVKGENTLELVEQFTAEVTLVAEGLCEDQSKLRNEMESLGRELDKRTQHIETALKDDAETIKEIRRDTDKKLDAMDARLIAMEKTLEKIEDKQKHTKLPRAKLMTQITILVSIICGSWVLVTVLNLLKP